MTLRVLDATLPVQPARGDTIQPRPHTLPADIEAVGAGRNNRDVQRICHVTPYQIGDDPDDRGADIVLGDNLPHAHAESLWINEVTILDTLPVANRWAVRDMATVPLAEFTREAAVIDLSGEDLDNGNFITAAMLAARGAHVRPGDFVLLRTDLVKKFGKDYLKHCPGLTQGAAEWLVRDRQIVGIGQDAGGLYSGPQYGEMQIHSYFYIHGVLMIDEMIRFDELGEERVFFAGGALRTGGIGSSPGRPIALPTDVARWRGGEAIDMFRPMSPTWAPLDGLPCVRREPPELRSELYKRFDVTWLQIEHPEQRERNNAQKGAIRPQRDFGSPIRNLSSHIGTHLLADRQLATRDLVLPGRRVNLAWAGPRHRITLQELQEACRRAGLSTGEAAILFTGCSDHYYHRPDHTAWSPVLDPEALLWLKQQGTPLVVSDLLSLDLPGSLAGTKARKAADLPVVLGATRLWRIEKPTVQVICSPMPLQGLDAYPSRVALLEQW
ncbi:MAG TPA: cyclase family protein [Ramlibacter sp.]|nr:cyclase family protein [Ramlibacter sp.]